MRLQIKLKSWRRLSVRAIELAGLVLIFELLLFAAAAAVTCPELVTIFPISPNPSYSGSYLVSWTEAGGTDFMVQESETPTFASNIIYLPTVNSIAVSGKASGTYYYTVKAHNAACWGPGWSLPRAVTVIIDAEPPTSPSSCNAWATSAKGISLSDKNAVWQSTTAAPYFEWAGATDNTGIAGYAVYYGPNDNDPGTSSTTANAYYDAGADPGTSGTYYLNVRTIDVARNYSAKTTLFTVKYDGSAPDNPSTSSAWETSGKTTEISSGVWQTETSNPYFEWNVPADNGASGLAGYYYYYGASAGGEPVNWLAGNSYDAGADPGTSGIYYLRLKTRDNAGNISVSSTVFAVKYEGLPAITDLAAKTDSAGAAISSDVWQPDNSPYFYWTAPVS